MRIANAMQATSSDLAHRKQAIMRKEMDQAYKKNSKYADPNKNPLLEALENLLSGKTEKELHENNPIAQFNNQEEENSTYNKGVVTDLVEEESLPLDENTQFILKQVHQAALSPLQPTAQDLRIAESVEAQLNSVQSSPVVQEIAAEREPFADEDVTFDVPDRFLQDRERDASADTVFGKDLERQLFNRTFTKAKAIYMTHMNMVKNSYRSYNEPTYSHAV